METKTPSQLGVLVTIHYTLNDRETVVQADQFPYLIGRDSSSVQLALPDAAVSRIHAQLTYQNGVVLLENISKTNKTSVNGQVIEQPVQINNGDQAVMGSCRLTFEIQACVSVESRLSEEDATKETAKNNPEQAAQKQPAQNDIKQADIRYCWQCGKALRPDAVFCADCGAAVDPEMSGQAMFCGSCGTKVDRTFQFCRQCGKSTTSGKKQVNVFQSVSMRGPATNKKRRKHVLVAALLVAVIAIAATVLLGGRSYKAVVKQYVDASVNGDFTKIWELLPKKVQEGAVDYIGQWYDVDDTSDVIDLLEDSFNSSLTSIKVQLGEKGKYSYEIVNEQEYSMRELNSLKEELQDIAGQNIAVSSAKTVLVELNVTEESGESHTHAMPVKVVEIGRSWYLGGLGY